MQTAANKFQEEVDSAPPIAKPEYNYAEGGEKMKALVWFGRQDVRMVEVPVPDITHPDDVIVQVTATTICGSDMHLYHGEIVPLQEGDILGHEFVGRVYKIGSNVKDLAIGQRVVASFFIACGGCESCKEGFSSFCYQSNSFLVMNYKCGQRNAGTFGYSHFTGGFPGGQAEYVNVPYGNFNLLPIPDNVSDERALYLSDVLCTSYHSVVDTGVDKGDVVGIWGLEPTGQCAARWALLKGASRVIGIDQVPSRVAFAREKLGIEVIDINEFPDVAKRIYEMVPQGFDVGLDCGAFREPKTALHKTQEGLMSQTDSPETINEMLASVRKGRRCGLFSHYVGYPNGIYVRTLIDKAIRFIGNGQAPVHKYWKGILNDYIETNKFDPTFMITHRVPFDDMAKLYSAFDKRLEGVQKVFVETRFSGCPGAVDETALPPLRSVDEWSR
ncbi:GroES-like protein [Marasmius fiardii PR-910]|nr:GroES-like protein [Marasmius fiardii PR-910]